MWNAPGTPQRIPTSFSAAPCGGLTRFTSGKPADLGQPKLTQEFNLSATRWAGRSAGRHRHRQILPHSVRDHRETRRSGLVRLQNDRSRDAVLRDALDAEDARIGDRCAETEERRGIPEAILRAHA